MLEMKAALTARGTNYSAERITHSPPQAGEYAHIVIGRHYQHIVECELGVIEDRDPEFLHQMRVNSRRLAAALRIFASVVKLPKLVREPNVRRLTKTMGELRDLDVQIARLEGDYCPRIHKQEQKHLYKLLDTFSKQRLKALSHAQSFLTHSRHEKFKQAFNKWLERPSFTALAPLPLTLILPELLTPLLSDLLLHPGWLVSARPPEKNDLATLHELRKTCKYIRYQAEQFTDFYPKQFSSWIRELKYLQDKLGTIQDITVFEASLKASTPKRVELPEVKELLQDRRADELFDWEEMRHKYLDRDFRFSLHQMLASPISANPQSVTTFESGG